MELVLLNGLKLKESFEKTRQVKNNDKFKKNTFYEDKEMQDIMKKYYQIQRNIIIYQNFVISISRRLYQIQS